MTPERAFRRAARLFMVGSTRPTKKAETQTARKARHKRERQNRKVNR